MYIKSIDEQEIDMRQDKDYTLEEFVNEVLSKRHAGDYVIREKEKEYE